MARFVADLWIRMVRSAQASAPLCKNRSLIASSTLPGAICPMAFRQASLMHLAFTNLRTFLNLRSWCLAGPVHTLIATVL